MEIDFNRIAVKVGSNVLTRRDGTLDVTRMSALVDQIAELHKAGIEIILVSSGAVASGRSEVHPTKKLDSVDQRQLFSAVGQAKLINRYYELFREHGIPVGQVLTMKENFSTRRHYLNQKNCMTVMLENGVIPIVNENDTISVSELMFTDNDELSGLIASMMDAQALIILSNIDGIYNGSPADPESQVIREIEQGKDLSSYIQTSKSSFGRGGMLTKTNIARKVADEGITVIIANGKRDNILVKIMNNEIIIKIKSLFPDLTKSEKRVALYVNEHFHQIIYLSIGDLASQCEVGETTILRFCKHLGFSGYYEFKQQAILQIEKDGQQNTGHQNKTLGNIHTMVQETTQLLDDNKLTETAQIIIHSQTIYVFGSGFSGLTAKAVQCV